MIRDHVRHLHRAIDEQSLPLRGVITLAALASLPVFGTAVRGLGAALDLGRLVLPLLVLAHVPVVVALVAVWSIGCDVCRSDRSA
ncbi:hypothetical protein [Halosimplex halobium]|uniref:hypothetical protein n=1 Tax=Halosimplex halobium TaxID=3396618 RepID=UPI003F576B70